MADHTARTPNRRARFLGEVTAALPTAIASLVAGAVMGGAAWIFGLDVPSAVIAGLATAGAGLALSCLTRPDEPGTVRSRERTPERAGSRGEAQELSWAMWGRGDRVTSRLALLRLRKAAAHRLARHGIEDPAADPDRVRSVLGARAASVLNPSAPPPRLSDVRTCLVALERLETDPSQSSAPTRSSL